MNPELFIDLPPIGQVNNGVIDRTYIIKKIKINYKNKLFKIF